MSVTTSRTYFDYLDIPRLVAEYPPGRECLDRFANIGRDELRALQNRRFLAVMRRGWQIPFYARRWAEAGLEAGDIRSLDDIAKLPVYDKSDLLASVETCPPFGDFSGWSADPGYRGPPAVFHTTSGTTGAPQPLLFGPKGREVCNLLVARTYLWQGLRDHDIVHSVYGHGTINGGHYIREAVGRFTRALLVPAGTGLETRSERQVELLAAFGATVIVGFVDYIRKLAELARQAGLVPGEDIRIRMISGHLGMEDREAVERAWGGARAYDWYGVGDTGCIAAEGPERDGLYVWEDAHHLELLDVADGGAVAPGSAGDMVVTCLYKDDLFPVIRFNTHDVSRELAAAAEPSLAFRRIDGFLGRSDNMVKLRGVNVFPHAIGRLLAAQPEFNGEFVCIVERDAAGRDGMRVQLEVAEPASDGLAERYARLLRRALGVAVEVEPVAARATAALTEIDRRQKPLRLLDRRFR